MSKRATLSDEAEDGEEGENTEMCMSRDASVLIFVVIAVVVVEVLVAVVVVVVAV